MRSIACVFLVLGSMILNSHSKMEANCCVDWSFLYIGGNTGWGWSDANWSATSFGATASRDFHTEAQSNSINGPLLGGQAGINWQMKRWVLGLEADFDGTGINGYGDITFPSLLLAPGLAYSLSSVYANIDWLTSLRGRLGRAWGATLVYVTGGVVWERLTISTLNVAQTATDGFPRNGIDRFHNTKTGWTVGAGCERMIASRWSVRAEYMYDQFSAGPILDSFFPNSETANNGASIAISNTSINSFRLGLNYTFKRLR